MYSIKKKVSLVNEFGEYLANSSGKYGLELGEYSFSDYFQDEETGEYIQDEFFYDDLKENIMSELTSLPVIDKLLDKKAYTIVSDILFDQPSSKSGVIVYVKTDIDIDRFVDLSQDYDDNDEIRQAYEEMSSQKVELEKALKIVRPYIESYADGKRSSVFSNGEVVFSPIGTGKQKGWDTFTSKWNPNME